MEEFSAIIHSGDIPTENGAIRFILMPTLQHMTAVKIASQFWAKKVIRDKIAVLYNTKKHVSLKSFTQLCREINRLLGKLPLPMKLIAYLSYIASRLAIEISRWMKSQIAFDPLLKPQNYLHCIQWTSRGRIDGEKTTELIISKEFITEFYKKHASEFYCFNLDGEGILNQMIHSEISLLTASSFFETYTLKAVEQARDTKTIRGPSFQYILSHITETALRRLWTSFVEETRSRILSNLRFYAGNMDHFSFLLSQMEEETQMNFLRRDPTGFSVGLFHNWLWQDFFIPTMLKLIPLMNPHNLKITLELIAHKMSFDLCNYQNKLVLMNFLDIIKQNLKPSLNGRNLYLERFIHKLIKGGRNLDIINQVISLHPSDKKKEYLDLILSSNRYSTDEKLDVLQFAFNVFENQEETEKHFLKNDCYFKYIRILIREGCIEKIEAFVKLFVSDEQKAANLKKKILLENLASCLRILVSKQKYLVINEILSICFTGNEQDIFEYRRKQIFKRTNPYVLAFLIKHRGGDLSALKEFFCFCFGQENGISVGKDDLMQDRSKLAKTSDYLLMFRRPSLIDEFLDWCFALDVEGKDAFTKDWKKISNKYGLYEIYRGCYSSEDPKGLLKGMKLPIKQLQDLKSFCNLMKWPKEDNKWAHVKKHIHQEIKEQNCRVGSSRMARSWI